MLRIMVTSSIAIFEIVFVAVFGYVDQLLVFRKGGEQK